MTKKTVDIEYTQIVVDRQALLDVVRALDMGGPTDRLPRAIDKLREPFFTDEYSSGQARTDGTMNTYDLGAPGP